jgi:hypothetical protein
MFSIFAEDSGRLYDNTVVIVGVRFSHVHGIKFLIIDYSDGSDLHISVDEEELLHVCGRRKLTIINKTNYKLGAGNV